MKPKDKEVEHDCKLQLAYGSLLRVGTVLYRISIPTLYRVQGLYSSTVAQMKLQVIQLPLMLVPILMVLAFDLQIDPVHIGSKAGGSPSIVELIISTCSRRYAIRSKLSKQYIRANILAGNSKHAKYCRASSRYQEQIMPFT